MGVTNCTCQKIETEEETIVKIFSSMNLIDIESKSVYNEFLKCINKEENYLDFFQFKNFLMKIIGENPYKKAQLNFFENLRKQDKKNSNIRRIGAMLIYLSKASCYQKIELLTDHFENFYKKFDEKTVKIFLLDIIESNTDNCLLSFREDLGYDVTKTLSSSWKKARKAKLGAKIYNNFECIKQKHLIAFKSPKLRIQKLNTSLDMETSVSETNNANIKEANRTITFLSREDLSEPYERFHKSESDQFFSSGSLSIDSNPISNERKFVKEFIELSYTQLSGEYIRSWMYDECVKERSDGIYY